MGDKPEAAPAPAKRGEAAWKAEKERVASRNAAARKAGKEARQLREREEADRKRAADLRESAALRSR